MLKKSCTFFTLFFTFFPNSLQGRLECEHRQQMTSNISSPQSTGERQIVSILVPQYMKMPPSSSITLEMCTTAPRTLGVPYSTFSVAHPTLALLFQEDEHLLVAAERSLPLILTIRRAHRSCLVQFFLDRNSAAFFLDIFLHLT